MPHETSDSYLNPNFPAKPDDMRPSAQPGSPPTPQRLGPAHKLPAYSGFDLPVNAVRTWTVPAVRGVIDNAEQGNIEGLADLSEYMQRDSALSAALDRRVHDLLRCPFRISPFTSSKRDLAVADAVRRFWPCMAQEVDLRQWVTSFHLMDFAPASVDLETIIDEDNNVWSVPKMRWRNPRYFYYDPGRVTWVDISYTGIIDVDVENGRHILATTWHMGKFPGYASKLAEDWLNKTFALRDFGEWRDLFAWPAIKGIVPAGGSDDNNEKTQFANELAGAVRNRVIMSQRDSQGNATYDAEVMPLAKGDEWKSFMEIVEYTDRKYQVAFLGGNVSSEVVDQGAKATAQAQLTSEIRMVQADNAALSQVLRDQLIRFFVTLNFGWDVDRKSVV